MDTYGESVLGRSYTIYLAIALPIAGSNGKTRYGHYPEAVQADKIYRNAKNLRYCEQDNIRLSGQRLGRPPADKEIQKEQKRLERQDARERNSVESKFGEGKRR